MAELLEIRRGRADSDSDTEETSGPPWKKQKLKFIKDHGSVTNIGNAEQPKYNFKWNECQNAVVLSEDSSSDAMRYLRTHGMSSEISKKKKGTMNIQ